jgi:malate dehydrogenase (oxaloacetate-decarboxylating)(NADP+)
MIEMHDTSLAERRHEYAEFLYSRLQRRGYLLRDCQRLVNNDRNVFAACMVAMGHADGMVTGVTRNWYTAYEDVRKVLDARPRRRVIGVSVALIRGRVVLVADVSVHDMPDGTQLADIAEEAVRVARRLAIEPRVALLAYSTFGHPRGERSDRVREAVAILDKRQVDFEYDGDMAADVALNREALKQYPFCRLSDTANVLVMPAFHSASISTKMLKELGGATLIGPVLGGLTHSVQICPLNSKDNEVVNMAALAAYDVNT